MFCEKCGTQILEGMAYCPECGHIVEQSSAVGGNAVSIPIRTNNDSNKKVGMIAAGIIAVLVIVFLVKIFGVIGGRSYKKTVDLFITGIFESDTNSLIEVFPDELISYVMKEEGMTRSQIREEMKKSLSDTKDYYDKSLGTWTYSYEILDVEDYNKNYLKNVSEDFEDLYGIKLSSCKTVVISFTVLSDSLQTTTTMNLELGKIGNSWYVIGVEGVLISENGGLF